MTIKAYTCLGSGNACKVELMLHLLNVDYEPIQIDVLAGEHRYPDFLALNPFGQVPVLVDGTVTLTDSQAILCYLVRHYGNASAEHRLPSERTDMGGSNSGYRLPAIEVQSGPTMAHASKLLGLKLGYDYAIQTRYKLLTLLNTHLREREWLGIRPSDHCRYRLLPLHITGRGGRVNTSAYTHVIKWLHQVETLPGFWLVARRLGLPTIELVPAPER
jgi:glutathione S-transferase